MNNFKENQLKIVEFKSQKQISDDRRKKRSEKREELRKRVEAIRNNGSYGDKLSTKH
ncbi:hypothetical protein [Litchfieldia salsa]|uniref:Uncharacterized protein n=1 Tax=Litchfieldia salsa TaxID=930152 RepID=A0A1H0T7W6_9BACI|nr:hypothetical protein [Litchfieldia salsa]SDP49698.1 hypothetical protein SAMN05216565_103314 [Litchfieldia salsa]